MTKFEMTLTVEMSDGRTLEVTGDQRDWAQMEVLDLPASAVVTRTRAIAWSALKRAALYNGRWDRFQEHDCVRVAERDSDDQDDQGDQWDPKAPSVVEGDAPPAGDQPSGSAEESGPKAGRPGPGGASTSSSRAPRAGRSKR